MRAWIVDPSAYTPPYDHALSAALADAGADVELITSEFAYGAVPPAENYTVRQAFYRHARGAPGGRLRRVMKLAEHVPDMLRLRRAAARDAPTSSTSSGSASPGSIAGSCPTAQGPHRPRSPAARAAARPGESPARPARADGRRHHPLALRPRAARRASSGSPPSACTSSLTARSPT